MSLINQVLNDLEKRGASTNIGEATIRVVPLQKSHAAFWWIFSLLSLSLLLVIVWLNLGHDIHLIVDEPTVISASSAPAQTQAASQPIANSTIDAEAEAAAVQQLNKPFKATAALEKPLVQMSPLILNVSPNPVTGNGSKQTLTLSGSNYASDAKLILRTPRRNVFDRREIVLQNADKIVFSVNFGKKAGPWSVEVVNPSGHSSGQFVFAVKSGAPVAEVIQPKNKAEASPVNDETTKTNVEAKPAPKNTVVKPKAAEKTELAVAEGGISKQVTQNTPQQQAENEFRKAYGLMQQSQISAAISGFETTLQLDAGHQQARQTLVRLLLEQKRSTDAERVLREGLQFDPKQSNLALLLARMQVGRNELSQALETVQKSLPYADKQADYQAFVAALLQRQNRHKEAIDFYRIALNLKPQSGVWQMGMGISLRAEKRTEEAREAFNRALESKSLNADLQAFVTQQLKEL